MNLEIQVTHTVQNIADEFNCHPDNVRLYKRELNLAFNCTDFDWVGYTKRISDNAYKMLKTYHFLIKDYGKSEAIKIIKTNLEGN